MDIAKRVEAHYKTRFTQLSLDKQFHFASRLSAWNNDSFSNDVLASRTDISREGDRAAITNDLHTLIHHPPAAKIDAAATRQAYFEAYPELRGYMLALFRVRHLKEHYNIDVRDNFLQLCPLDSLTRLSFALQADPEAIKILSTYAINYLYLVHTILYPKQAGRIPIATQALSIADDYDMSVPEHIQLFIYLYTHCIIGESNFYKESLEYDRDQYRAMLEQLEQVINQSYDDINLDNKLEFLVCCRLMEYETDLFDRIYTECRASLSIEGDFVVDTVNRFKQSNKTSLSDSEHRNILLIMSASSYPHSKRI